MPDVVATQYLIQAADELIRPWLEVATFHAKLMLANSITQDGKQLYQLNAHLGNDDRMRRFFADFLPLLGSRVVQVMTPVIVQGTRDKDHASQIILEIMATEGMTLLDWAAEVGVEANADVVARMVHSSYSLYREFLPDDTNGPLPPDVDMPAGRRAARHLEELRRRMIQLRSTIVKPEEEKEERRGRGRPKGSVSRDPEQVKKIAEGWLEAKAAGSLKEPYATSHDLTVSQLNSILALYARAKKNPV